MIEKIAIIPARSGSKGLPNKNILMLLDKPLIAYTIQAAIGSDLFDRVIVSTDSLQYKEIAEQYGAEVILRNKELSSDTATSFMVIEDILYRYPNLSYFALLQPTSPFRDSEHIKKAIFLFENSIHANFLVSVTQSSKNSDLIKCIESDLSLKNFNIDFSNYRRQNSNEYSPNGAIFIGKPKSYLEKKHFFGDDSIAYIMNRVDSIDIDDKLDFEFAICIQTQRNKKKSLFNSISKRIEEKKSTMNNTAPITLIGHSIFDYWNINSISNNLINNIGIAGINSKEYLDLILNKNLITNLGNKIFLFFGTNDIVLTDWIPKLTIEWIKKIIYKIKEINSCSNIYFLSIPPVRGRIDRNNILIKELNTILRKELINIDSVVWIELSNCFYDKFGDLPAEFTYDGLHFSSLAYQQLEKEIAEVL